MSILQKFRKNIKTTFKKIKTLYENKPKMAINSKVNKLIEYINSSQKQNLKVIVFITMKFIVINLQKLLGKHIDSTEITIALNSKTNQALIKKLPHRVYLKSLNEKGDKRFLNLNVKT